MVAHILEEANQLTVVGEENAHHVKQLEEGMMELNSQGKSDN